MNASALLRAVRRARQLSQRELAARSRVSVSTIDRIESGRSRDPGVNTRENILNATGYALTITDRWDRCLDLDIEHQRLRDRGDRRFPAHLEAFEVTRHLDDPWWGWGRIAWTPDDPKVPAYSFFRRYPSQWQDAYYRDSRWNDAT